jgi:hypothetical protein
LKKCWLTLQFIQRERLNSVNSFDQLISWIEI